AVKDDRRVDEQLAQLDVVVALPGGEERDEPLTAAAIFRIEVEQGKDQHVLVAGAPVAHLPHQREDDAEVAPRGGALEKKEGADDGARLAGLVIEEQREEDAPGVEVSVATVIADQAHHSLGDVALLVALAAGEQKRCHEPAAPLAFLPPEQRQQRGAT